MASSRQRKGSTRSTKTNSRRVAKPAPRKPFTVDHFRAYADLMVYDDGEKRGLEDWQVEIASDIFAGYREVWQITPEGNGKSTFIALLALYGADFSDSPWIPIGASSAKQARIVYNQAEGFVERTEGMEQRFRCFGGYKLIRSRRNGGIGIEVFAADAGTGDGVIPYPFALMDELHRTDMSLYKLWKGKLRKRGAQILAISTAGEPETPFETTRDEIRRKAKKRKRVGSHLRAEGDGLVFHEWMVPSDAACSDMKAVARANPLSTVTAKTLAEDFNSPTTDLGDWKRLKCNRATRSAQTAITDAEWDDAETEGPWVEGESTGLGLDVAWKWDTTAFTPLWCSPDWQPAIKPDKERGIKGRPPCGYRVVGPASILVPPRNGSTLHPDEIKDAFTQLAEQNQPDTVVMDTSKAEDIAAWLEEQGVTVIERGNTNLPATQDYEAVMEGLRNGTLKHTGDAGLRSHVLNAIARRLPGGDRRFDRPSTTRQNVKAQDRRVIDALTAMGMVVYISNFVSEPSRSVYEDRDLVTV